LEHAVICPHCRYRPKDEPYIQQVSISKLNEELEELLTSWTETVISTLNDTEIKESITLLNVEQRQLIEQFVQDGKFSSPVDLKLVQTLKDLFEGIRKVELSVDQLVQMAGNGHPLTVDELRSRFEEMIRNHIGTGHGNRVRILLRKGDIQNG
jgi:succinate dehydrogenase flavin-adding protein (antitoxin of CptAB toxin-antitoxin module)